VRWRQVQNDFIARRQKHILCLCHWATRMTFLITGIGNMKPGPFKGDTHSLPIRIGDISFGNVGNRTIRKNRPSQPANPSLTAPRNLRIHLNRHSPPPFRQRCIIDQNSSRPWKLVGWRVYMHLRACHHRPATSGIRGVRNSNAILVDNSYKTIQISMKYTIDFKKFG
jgi:hypothetical protein